MLTIVWPLTATHKTQFFNLIKNATDDKRHIFSITQIHQIKRSKTVTHWRRRPTLPSHRLVIASNKK